MSEDTPSLGEELLGRWYTQAFRNDRPDMMEWSLEMLSQVSATGYAGCAAALKNIHLLQDLPALRAQTLYISGKQDGQTPAKMTHMSEITSGARFAEIDPGAHFPNVESASLFNELLVQFYCGSGRNDNRRF